MFITQILCKYLEIKAENLREGKHLRGDFSWLYPLQGKSCNKLLLFSPFHGKIAKIR